ncbi:MAG TPA: hypothetical protein PK847_04890 [Candidatus Sumerlaeota bacterium]|nr:hypothetical protein [Candidatus Sumerlaeota bacterium]HOR29555.1 hypothetical protein [Candidatus Sumerlaeota bacterium]
MRQLTPWLLLLAMSSGLAGCYSLRHTTASGKPVMADTALAENQEITQHFKETARSVYLLDGLIPLDRDDAQALLYEYVNAGDGIVNLRIREQFTFIDSLIGWVTLGIVTTRTVRVEGDVFINRTVASAAPVLIEVDAEHPVRISVE